MMAQKVKFTSPSWLKIVTKNLSTTKNNNRNLDRFFTAIAPKVMGSCESFLYGAAPDQVNGA